MKKIIILSLFLFWVLGFTTPVFAVTRYVAKTGSDSNTCAQSTVVGTAKLTIAAGLACMAAGDILQIRAGTYDEIIKTSSQTIAAGTASSPVTIQGYPGDAKPIIMPTGSPYAVVEMLGSTHKYIVFDGIIFDATNVTNYSVNAGGTAGYNTWINCEMRNSDRSSILVGKDSNFNKFINNYIHNGGSALTGASCCGYGIYVQGSDNLIEGNIVTEHTGYGIHNYSGFTNGTHRNKIRKNHVYGNTTDSAASGSAGILIGSGDGNVAEYNLVEGHPYGIMVGYNAAINSKVYNNTVNGATTAAIHVRSSSSATTIQNNLLYSNPIGVQLASGASATQITNRTTNPNYIDTASNNYGLQAGSAAINAGTAITSHPYNGSAPDQGAHETFTCTSVLPDTAGDNTIVITCENNLAPPLLPATGCLGFSAKKNDVANAITNCSRTADNQITLTLTNSYINTDVAKWSYVTASGNITDSMKIGGTLNQRLNAVTDQIPTNQIGISAPVLTQVSGRFSVGGTEAAADRKLQNNTELAVPPKACFNYRVCISNTIASFGESGYTLRAQKNGAGGYLAISNGPTPLTGISFIEGTGRFSYLLPGPTTEQLNCSNTFVPGGAVLSASEVPNIILAVGEETELIFGLCVGENNADNDYFDLRVYSAGGIPLTTYTQTGRVRVRTTAAFSTQIGAP